MEEVEGDGEEEAEGEGEDDPLVGAADWEHEFGEGAEGDGLVCWLVRGLLKFSRYYKMAYVGIERLNYLSRPDICSFDRK